MIELIELGLILGIIFGTPIFFLIEIVVNLERILKSKRDKTEMKKSWVVKAVVFGLFFIVIVILYGYTLQLFSRGMSQM